MRSIPDGLGKISMSVFSNYFAASAALIGVLVSCTKISDAVDSPPNIILILADDLGYADLGCYGHPYAKTPNLDQLADEGTRFTQFYVTGVTCSPSRTGLMTGLFPARFSKNPADFGFGDRETVTSLLKTRGYRTGHFGKWHIGPNASAVDGTYGIDQVERIGSDRQNPGGRDTGLFTAAINFIQESASEEVPFYVNIWGHSTHSPVDVPAELENQFEGLEVDRSDFSASMQEKFDDCLEIGGNLNNSMRQYLGDVYSIDLNVGRVLAELENLGLRDNTIVVFSSDHGPAPIKLNGNRDRETASNMLGYSGEFRGGKHDQYEGGIRVPFIVRWPEHVPAGKTDSESVVSFVDWMPTICDIVGIDDLPGPYDGENVSDILRGATRNRTKPLFWKTSARLSSPSMRDGKWKFHMPRNLTSEMELFNLNSDPSESQNVAPNNPEVVNAMSIMLEEWVGELPDRFEDGSGIRQFDPTTELSLSHALLKYKLRRKIRKLKKAISTASRMEHGSRPKKFKKKMRNLKKRARAL